MRERIRERLMMVALASTTAGLIFGDVWLFHLVRSMW